MFFFFNDTATTEIYTLSLHDALPISIRPPAAEAPARGRGPWRATRRAAPGVPDGDTGRCPAHRQGPLGTGARHQCRSEEHTSELQSRLHLVCRLLLEKKKSRTVLASCVLTHDAVPGKGSGLPTARP